MIHVEDAAHGNNCGCTCAECGKPLIASNKEPRKVAKYFRHAIGAACPGGLETAIHRAAKEVLLRRKFLMAPGKSQTVSFSASDGRQFSRTISLQSRSFHATEAHEEVWQVNMRPDVVFFVNSTPLYIEVRVTHAVDEEKREKIQEKGIEAIEINLSDLSQDEIFDMSTFEKKVCHELNNRLWVSWPEFDDLLDTTIRELRELRDNHEDSYQEAEKIRIALEQQEADLRQKEELEKREAILEKISGENRKRDQMRKVYSKELSRIYEFQSEEKIAAWNSYLQGFRLYASVQSDVIDSSPFLLKPVDGFWIFKARYQDWQSYILDLLFPNRPSGKKISVREIRNCVVCKFGVIDWVETIHKLEYARKQYPNSDRGLVLYTTEVGIIPDAYTVVDRYIGHLAKLHLIGQRLEWIDGDWMLPLARAVNRHNERQEEQLRKAEREEREKKAYLETQKQRHLNSWKLRKDHELAIIASEMLVFRTVGRVGLRCKHCYLLNPLKTHICRYCCNAGLSMRVDLDDEFMRTSRFKVRTSAEVSRILLNLPELELADLQPIMMELREAPSE